MKKITVNIPEYIQSVVDLEEKIKFAQSPNYQIPELKYPQNKMKETPTHAFLKEIQSILP